MKCSSYISPFSLYFSSFHNPIARMENADWDHNFVALGRLSPDRFRKPSEKVHLVRKEISHLIHQAIKSPTSVSPGGAGSPGNIAKNRPGSRAKSAPNFGLDTEGSIGNSTLIGAISLTSEVVPAVAVSDTDEGYENYDDAFEVDEPATGEPVSSVPAPPREMVPMPDHLVTKAEKYWNNLVTGKHVVTN
jgi:hypothetical protein